MRQRVFTTVGLWAAVVGLLWLFGFYGGLVLIVLFSELAQKETYRLLSRTGGDPLGAGGRLAGLLFLGLVGGLAVSNAVPVPYAVSLGIVLPSLAAWVMVRSPVHQLPRRLFPTLTGFLLVPGCLAFLLLTATLVPAARPEGLFLAVWVVAVAKFSDVGALLVGGRIGRRPLAPAYSPKKTVEGAAGGVLTSVVVGAALPLAFPSFAPDTLPFFLFPALAVLLAVAAILSDLLGSALKRAANVKDSGARIPGIGGGLDLVDSLLLSAPLGYAVLSLAL